MLTLYITKKGRRIRADTYGPVGASGEWATQGCSGRVVVEVGARFHPERLIGGTEAASPGAAEATLYVCSGALVQGGVFDLSAGSIWLGAGALVEPGVLLRGPAVIGAGTVLRHGAYIRGDVVLGGHGVFGGELALTLTLSLTLSPTLSLTLSLTLSPTLTPTLTLSLSLSPSPTLSLAPDPNQASSRASSRSTMSSCRTRATAATRCSATARTSAAARSRPTSRSSPARGRRSRCVARGTTSAAASWALCWATTASSAAVASRSQAA